MTMSRRSMFSRMVVAAAAGFAASRADASPAAVQKVVYHLSDLGKAAFVLGNIANHIEGKGGPDKVRIVLVVHGEALGYFQASKTNPDTQRKLARLAGDGVALAACGNTLKAQNLAVSDLLPGFDVATEGGVVRIADLQEQGYVYIRP